MSIDVLPGTISWFPPFMPWTAEREQACRHHCQHRWTDVVAWGPTWVCYELHECNTCHCRSWFVFDNGVLSPSGAWWQPA